MSKRKIDAKAFAQQKRRRRQWITFIRMCRYGVNNFSRNAWLTVAATAVMTITLLIVFMTLAARNTLQTTVEATRDKVDLSIYLDHDTTKDQADSIMNDISKLKTVRDVSYVSPEQARSDFAKSNGKDPDTLAALNEAANVFPGTIHVKLVDINDTKELANFVATNENIKSHLDANRPPSFTGAASKTIKRIASWIDFADRAGLIATIVFVAISSLIVFNTIRMAIFNRREEIQMMKLIGADRSFIRGPFIVEAIVYGFIAAVIATGLGVLALVSAQGKLHDYGVAIQPTVDFAVVYIGFVLLGMILLGALIGIVSSFLATRRYLKI